MLDQFFNVVNSAWPARLQYASHVVNDVSAPSGVSSPKYAMWIPYLNQLLDGIYAEKIIWFPSFFLVLIHDFMIYIAFTRTAAWNTASDDVTL